MKNLFFIGILFSVLALGCGLSPKVDSRAKTDNDYDVVTIDGCEYIEVDQGVLDARVYSLTHKGNCKNPIHIYNK